jgi:NAD-dependent deacetylase
VTGLTIVPLSRRPKQYRRVVVLTGAGISVASGLPTFRGPGGLWERNPELAAEMTAGANLDQVWRTFGPLRAQLRAARPNAAHLALAAFEARVVADGGSVTVVTQNIDGLHSRAGSRSVLELHGTLLRTRCSREGCAQRPFDDDAPHDAAPPCPTCGAPLRPAVVLFEEPIEVDAEVGSKRALRDSDLFLSIGTSGTVWPASSFVRSASYEGAHTITVNLTEPEPNAAPFDEVMVGAAEEVLPELLG